MRMSRETRKKGLKLWGQKNRPSMLITCSAAFFLQDITDITFSRGPLALVVLVAPVEPLALPEPVLGQELGPPPLLSWQAQPVSSLVLMGNLLT